MCERLRPELRPLILDPHSRDPSFADLDMKARVPTHVAMLELHKSFAGACLNRDIGGQVFLEARL